MKLAVIIEITIVILLFLQGLQCQVAPTGLGFSIAQYGTTLTTTQVVGDESCHNRNFYGTGGCVLDRGATSRPLITCEIIHNAEDPQVVTIQKGFAGSNQTTDKVIYTFQKGEFQYGFFSGEIIRSTFDINEDSEDELAFFNGMWYILIKTLECPNGALRGQFSAQFNVGSYLKGGNEVPPVASPEQGIALGIYDYVSNTLVNRLDFTSKRVSSIGIYKGKEGVEGEAIYNYTKLTAPIDEVIVFSDADEENLLAQALYYNIKSTFYPFGELRGQLHLIDPIPSINYAFRLTASNVVPPLENNYVGIGLFSIDCSTGFAEYMITHNVPDVSGAFIKSGAAGTQGTTLAALHGYKSPIFGSFTFDLSIYDLLTSDELYIEITSFSNPKGVIRSQIIPEYSHYSYISGYQEIPIVSTYIRGNGLFNNDGSYLIIHNGGIRNQITAANLETGGIGSTGSFVSAFSSSISPMSGTISQSNFNNGQHFVNLISSNHTSGEARGQILSCVNRCPVIPPYEYSRPATGYWVTKSRISTTSSSDSSVVSLSVFLMLLIVVVCI